MSKVTPSFTTTSVYFLQRRFPVMKNLVRSCNDTNLVRSCGSLWKLGVADYWVCQRLSQRQTRLIWYQARKKRGGSGKRPLRTAFSCSGRVEEVELSVSVQRTANISDQYTGVIKWKPGPFFGGGVRGRYLELQTYSSHEFFSMFSCTPYLSLELETGSK
jgi:hypothetical protein